jgi:hypothetical protein
MFDEWGRSSEPVSHFVARNDFPACPEIPMVYSSAKEVSQSKKLPFLPILGFENEDWARMTKEAEALEGRYVFHRKKESHKGWSSICLHGISERHTEAPHVYGYNGHDEAPYIWTKASEDCPTIRGFLQRRLGYSVFYRVRIMKLDPGGSVAPHRDSLTEDENFLGPINVAINHPDGCKFYMDNIGYLPFRQGTVMQLNLHHAHCVYNESSEPRYHMIVHGKRGSSWPQRIFNSYRELLRSLYENR